MKYDLIIFDLDGTLLNTLDDLADACNAALREAGYPGRDRDDVRRFIGNGVARLIRRALPESAGDDVAARVLARFKAIYLENVNVKTLPYPGVVDMLRRLHDRGVRIAVNSNKVDEASRLLCAAHFPGLVDLVLGEQPDIPKKPDPEGARRIMAALDVPPERALYVGDGDADVLTARNAGIDGAWVSWGYRTREELPEVEIKHHFDSAIELEKYILS
ncbi:MAG: HAD-IA family hydrolase [Clostridia bacterium]|nr:HAD-IA family hydrolase [Clostridia bacterium]